MPIWPFSSLVNKEDEMNKECNTPSHVAVLPYLEFNDVLNIVTVPTNPEFLKYLDPPRTVFTTQFARLKLFLDANLLDRNGRAWKDLQEADPDFRKIRMIYEVSDYVRADMGWPEEPVTSFPEEWKDEDYFICWLYVNILLRLESLDTGTLEKASHVIMHTDYVQTWRRCREEQRRKIEAEMPPCDLGQDFVGVQRELDDMRKIEKEKKKLEKQKEKEEKKLEKEKLKEREMLARRASERRRIDKAENN